MKNLASYFRGLGIRKKILTTHSLTCALSVFLACTAFVANEAFTVKSVLQNDLATHAEVIDKSCTGAVASNDALAAEEAIHSLEIKPNILSAYILTADHRILASYHQHNVAGSKLPLPGGGTVPDEAAAGSIRSRAPDTILRISQAGFPLLHKPLRPAKLRALLTHLIQQARAAAVG